ncbi:DUF401 family protein [Candidatus Bathyarchaeota archaeon]|nr:DUF401 family protein [Candidatus Bathyarchaeota archaeon]MBS7630634.1 DUF401 family protein [Candidatus Bathyarchaeota archaeon]
MVAFGLLIALRLKNIDFTLSLIVSSLILGFTSEKPPTIFIDVAITTLTDPVTWDIFSSVALITLLGYILKETGLMTETIGALRSFLSSRVLLSAIPALFGILTMPGGALMSAPFNEPEADRLKLKAEHKTFVNVWFRHVWFWASPLSPTLILAAALAGFSQREFIFAEAPMLFVSILIGLVASQGFLKRGENANQKGKYYSSALTGLAPIILVVILSLIGLPVWLALTLGLIVALAVKHVGLKHLLVFLRKGIRWDIALTVLAMLYFRYLILASGSVNSLLSSLLNSGIPLLLILIAVPVSVGMISATPSMGLAIVFPLLIPLSGSLSVYLSGFIYAGIVAGYLASPMHLCLVLTNGYYQSSLGKVYRYLIPSTIALYLVTGIYNLSMNNLYNI